MKPQTSALSEAQIIQRTDARSKAVISRRLKQLQRLKAQVLITTFNNLEVIKKLAEAGVEVEPLESKSDAAENPESEREICSAAGVALRRCAQARREARRAARVKKRP